MYSKNIARMNDITDPNARSATDVVRAVYEAYTGEKVTRKQVELDGCSVTEYDDEFDGWTRVSISARVNGGEWCSFYADCYQSMTGKHTCICNINMVGGMF